MIKENSSRSIRNFFKEKVFIFLNENARLITQFLFTALFIILAAWFTFHQKRELFHVRNLLTEANRYWVITGLALVLFYIFIQGAMYVTFSLQLTQN